ncbi:hypothetical protein VTN49DRAFT_2323 [Thermomyces lanuginosus]|uniref:uncharacterized protein n=1 Tax=Thermomyces lanuginosus TaxID=5541 RepID=UPI003742652C
MANFVEVAQQFVQFYYNTFDTNRQNLKELYGAESMLTFETSSILGKDAIMEKLMSLPFQKVEHVVNTLDAQPSNPNGGVLVQVTGHLKVDDEQKMSYTQTFQLIPGLLSLRKLTTSPVT